nr:hypothetical protein [uncultured Undibacterium sp.]
MSASQYVSKCSTAPRHLQYEVKYIVKMVATNINAVAYIARAILGSSVEVNYA